MTITQESVTLWLVWRLFVIINIFCARFVLDIISVLFFFLDIYCQVLGIKIVLNLYIVLLI